MHWLTKYTNKECYILHNMATLFNISLDESLVAWFCFFQTFKEKVVSIFHDSNAVPHAVMQSTHTEK